MRRALLATTLGLVLAPAAGSAALPTVPPVVPHLPTRHDTVLSTKLARLARGYDGWAAVWVENLKTGSWASWNADSAFPAASTVKIAVMAEGIRRFGFGASSPIDGDLRAIGEWSDNDAANDIYARVGGMTPIDAALHRLGMFSSTFPGPYRDTAAAGKRDDPDPPNSFHTRLTTARDLGRALFRLQAAAAGQRWAIRDTELTQADARAELGYLSLDEDSEGLLTVPAGVPHAEKDGWLDDTHNSAAIVYLRRGARIVVVLTYRPEVTLDASRAFGTAVSKLALADG